MRDRQYLRATFDEVAELYERARATYPRELFADLAQHLPRGARVVEIGPGTGQATRALAEHGYEVVAVELGPNLAQVARRVLARDPNVEVVNADVETWEPRERFDAAAAFTAFHWLDPETRYATMRRLLRDDGVLAVVETRHVFLPGGDPFWTEVQPDYVELGLSDDPSPPPHPDEVDDLRAEIDASGRFRMVDVRRYTWDVIYDADRYVDVLDTYSPNRALDAETRQRLYTRVRARMGDATVTKTYLAILNVARAI